MFINFFSAVDFIGLNQRGSGITTGPSPIPGGNSNVFINASGTNTYSGNTPATIGSYVQGLSIIVLFQNANTNTSTININGLGSVPIKKNGGQTSLQNGDIIAGGIYTLVYDGAEFQIVIAGGL